MAAARAQFDQDQALRAVGACLDRLGSTRFNQAMIDLATGPIGADQCMIFSYGPARTRCFLSYNTRPRGEARALAEKYVMQGYPDDPVAARFRNPAMPEGIGIVPFADLKPQMSRDYQHVFFRAPGLVDKLAVTMRRRDLNLCLNFYRYEETGPFGADFIAQATPLLRIAGQMVLLQYQSSDDHSLEDPLLTLSDREQEVCRWILKGLTSEAIAYEMDISPNTVSTFRKRAYDKLAINSKSALFELCQSS